MFPHANEDQLVLHFNEWHIPVTMVAPPFVRRDDYVGYRSAVGPRPSIDLAVSYVVNDWPSRGLHVWTQRFDSGVERPARSSLDSCDVEVECRYVDLVAFVYGLRPLEEFAVPANVMRGSVGGLSSMFYLNFDQQSLRTSIYSLAARLAIVSGLENGISASSVSGWSWT